ncbi:MAG: T9SS type A sorting domain-containing protein [Bacteroidota bacterium]
MKKIILVILTVLATNTFVASQEVVVPLETPVQKLSYQNFIFSPSQKALSDTIQLPFLDDFSSSDVYPDASLWSDNFVYINSSYPKNPPTLGVASFDALNDSGNVYTQANFFPVITDYLTSKGIRLDSLFSGTPRPILNSDSVYFSFFYQPQGMGNAPEDDDSLVLQFYSPTDMSWKHMWSAPGETFSAFYSRTGKSFDQVIIHVDSAFYESGFRFRFYNYTSLANLSNPSWAQGNVDIWNIDYVYLNTGRSIADTIYDDVCISRRVHSLLTPFQQMPWDHFQVSPTTYMLANKDVYYSNLGPNTKNVKRDLTITDLLGLSVPYIYSGGNLNQAPYSELSFNVPFSTYQFTSTVSSDAEFEIKMSAVTTPDLNSKNDTFHFHQNFYNYYAYDDGSPEFGYGLNVNNGKVAYQYTLAKPDHIWAVTMFFNRTKNNASQKNFYLTIWNDAAGTPGSIIYSKANTKPLYEDSLNEFHTYVLDSSIYMSGTFYIGWVQTTTDVLNVGLDSNTSSQQHIFYNTSGAWNNSIFPGSLMIRPVVGNTAVGIPEIKTEISFSVFPNPANTQIHFKLQNESTNNPLFMQVFDITGKQILHQEFIEVLDISTWNNGLYLVRIFDSKGNLAGASKFQVSH